MQGNHLHLIVEADGSAALTRGMQGLAIRLARALNSMMGRKGPVFGDHYHERLLRSPTEVVNAIGYVLGNAKHHFGEETDRYASTSLARERREEVLAAPRGWLLRDGIHRAPVRGKARLRAGSIGPAAP